jgi:hypothetical protein
MRIPYTRPLAERRLTRDEQANGITRRSPNAACAVCGNVSSRKFPVRLRSDGLRRHEAIEACSAAGRARLAAEAAGESRAPGRG